MRTRTAASDAPATARRLRRELIGALVLKAALLAAIFLLCFDTAHRPRADAEATAAALTGVHAARVLK